MYKVFVNEKKLSLTQNADHTIKNIKFDGTPSLEMALDFLENTATKAINIYGENLQDIWASFTSLFKIIEASGGIVYNKKNDILFIHRLGKWDLPKGKLEKGESLAENAVREVSEETGLSDVILDQFINQTFHVYTERNGEKILKRTNWFRMYYHGAQQPVPQKEEGINKVSWKTEAEIKTEVLPKTFQNIALILNEVAQLQHL